MLTCLSEKKIKLYSLLIIFDAKKEVIFTPSEVKHSMSFVNKTACTLLDEASNSIALGAIPDGHNMSASDNRVIAFSLKRFKLNELFGPQDRNKRKELSTLTSSYVSQCVI